ncbi:ATP-binding cassette domain-containing protein [Klenkia sp. PcliD-1-E]|uniref:ATP-binding cassette domain-containing protein n=1 Tax=Klenkia sp. PcliD-1-E TaxID=2954492 RepID=UPI00209804FC|nr:ATP-binding cassette domain-containing protein [Klenkia sp. PcliD-1-E]MCO7220525.1 ATP-binding cassette domain-containing protein [Klenkia sp. PcliD-1-E]
MSGFAARGVVKRFTRGAETVTALAGVDLAVGGGQFMALVGPSGSGKSTLLAVLCGWEAPDEGTLEPPVDADQGWSDLALVPQALGLVADLSLLDNVLLPARLRERRFTPTDVPGDPVPLAHRLMADFGLEHLADRYPHQASLGEQQRVAVARALVLRPGLLLADEPTAHQDRDHADVLLDALRDAALDGTAVLLATHDEVAWSRADRVVSMRDGRLTDGAPA